MPAVSAVSAVSAILQQASLHFPHMQLSLLCRLHHMLFLPLGWHLHLDPVDRCKEHRPPGELDTLRCKARSCVATKK